MMRIISLSFASIFLLASGPAISDELSGPVVIAPTPGARPPRPSRGLSACSQSQRRRNRGVYQRQTRGPGRRTILGAARWLCDPRFSAVL